MKGAEGGRVVMELVAMGVERTHDLQWGGGGGEQTCTLCVPVYYYLNQIPKSQPSSGARQATHTKLPTSPSKPPSLPPPPLLHSQ